MRHEVAVQWSGDAQPLIERINRQHGTYITDYAERIGFGSKTYKLVDLDTNK